MRYFEAIQNAFLRDAMPEQTNPLTALIRLTIVAVATVFSLPVYAQAFDE